MRKTEPLYLRRIGTGKLHKSLIKDINIIFVSSFILVFFFEPFLASLLPIYILLISALGCALCSAIAYGITVLLFRVNGVSDSMVFFNIKGLIVFMTSILLATSLIYFYLLFLDTIFLDDVTPKYVDNVSNHFFLKVFLFVFNKGLFVYLILKSFPQLWQMIHQKKSESPATPGRDSKDQDLSLLHPSFTIYGKNCNEQINVIKDGFIFAKSDGHFIKVYYRCAQSKQIKSSLIRNSMTNLGYQTMDFNTIYRCHKSYFVNLNHLKNIRTSNKGIVQIGDHSFKVSISKDKIAYIRSLMNDKASDKDVIVF